MFVCIAIKKTESISLKYHIRHVYMLLSFSQLTAEKFKLKSHFASARVIIELKYPTPGNARADNERQSIACVRIIIRSSSDAVPGVSVVTGTIA